MSASGIYQILNIETGKRYIGSAVNFDNRWWIHLSELRKGKHHSPKLQHAWNKYGEAAFKFVPVIECQKSMLLFYEQQMLDKVQPEYNICKRANSALGVKRSPEFRAKLLGHPVSEAAREKMRAAKLGKPQSEEHLALRIAGMTGHVVSQDARVKIGAVNAVHAAIRSAAITHCPGGHEYTAANTYTSKRRQRSCRTCSRIRMRDRRSTAQPTTL